MPKFLIRVNVEYTTVIEAANKKDAIEQAPELEVIDTNYEFSTSNFEAELVIEDRGQDN